MQALLNQYVFKSRLKLSTELDSQIYEGNDFQSTGAAKTNDRSPNVTKVFTERWLNNKFSVRSNNILDGDLMFISSIE